MIAFRPKTAADFSSHVLNRAQKLFTLEQARALPPLYSQDGKGFAATVHVKYFAGGLTWLATEFSPDDELFFGYVVNHRSPDDSEFGYFSVSDICSCPEPKITRLQETNSFKIRPAIERDIHFTACSVREAVKELTGKPPRLDDESEPAIDPAEAAAIAEFESDQF